MIRLTVLLCAGIFVVLLVQGEDRGQVRHGLIELPPPAFEAQKIATPEPVVRKTVQVEVTEAVFVPAQPVRTPPPPPPAEPVTGAAPLPEPAPAATWAIVEARSVNVRAGPSTADAVIGRLNNGETVQLVAEAAPVDGWSLVRIEGDGVEGYVATRFLTGLTP